MKDKYDMTQEQNIFLAKRNIVDSIWRSSHIEGIDVTYPETQKLYDGGNVARLRLDEIQIINNLKHAWLYILNSVNVESDLNFLKSINSLVGSNLIDRAGQMRVYEERISGTNYVPELPNEEEVKKKLNEFAKIKCVTERAITIMCYLMRLQFFSDGNKRTSMLFANKIMIQNGKGIITIPIEEDEHFGKELTRYYETNNMENLKQFIYDKCIEGIVINNK